MGEDGGGWGQERWREEGDRGEGECWEGKEEFFCVCEEAGNQWWCKKSGNQEGQGVGQGLVDECWVAVSHLVRGRWCRTKNAPPFSERTHFSKTQTEFRPEEPGTHGIRLVAFYTCCANEFTVTFYFISCVQMHGY